MVGDSWVWAWTVLTTPLAFLPPRLQQPGFHIQPIPLFFFVPGECGGLGPGLSIARCPRPVP